MRAWCTRAHNIVTVLKLLACLAGWLAGWLPACLPACLVQVLLGRDGTAKIGDVGFSR